MDRVPTAGLGTSCEPDSSGAGGAAGCSVTTMSEVSMRGVTSVRGSVAVNKSETPVVQIASAASGASSGRLIQNASGMQGACGGVRNRSGIVA
jgi:hypothetical protein